MADGRRVRFVRCVGKPQGACRARDGCRYDFATRRCGPAKCQEILRQYCNDPAVVNEPKCDPCVRDNNIEQGDPMSMLDGLEIARGDVSGPLSPGDDLELVAPSLRPAVEFAAARDITRVARGKLARDQTQQMRLERQARLAKEQAEAEAAAAEEAERRKREEEARAAEEAAAARRRVLEQEAAARAAVEERRRREAEAAAERERKLERRRRQEAAEAAAAARKAEAERLRKQAAARAAAARKAQAEKERREAEAAEARRVAAEQARRQREEAAAEAARQAAAAEAEAARLRREQEAEAAEAAQKAAEAEEARRRAEAAEAAARARGEHCYDLDKADCDGEPECAYSQAVRHCFPKKITEAMGYLYDADKAVLDALRRVNKHDMTAMERAANLADQCYGRSCRR